MLVPWRGDPTIDSAPEIFLEQVMKGICISFKLIAYKTTKSASSLLTIFHYTSIHLGYTSRPPEDYQRFLAQVFHLYVMKVIASYTEAFLFITGLYTKHNWKIHKIQALIYLQENFYSSTSSE